MTAGLERFLGSLQRVKQTGPDEWIASCPAVGHGKGGGDIHPSMSINRGNGKGLLLKCHAGCRNDDIVAGAGMTWQELLPPKEPIRRKPSPAVVPPTSTSITVSDLARGKNLPLEFLQSLGLEDRPDFQKEGRKDLRGVLIPYRMMDGSPAARQRARTALTARAGSVWLPGDGSPVPYGLDRLPDASKEGFLALVEGESDCWTLWHHGVQALGIPGVDMTGKIQLEHLEGISEIFYWREPDKGGDTFAKNIPARLREIGYTGQVREMKIDGVKDANDLHKRDPEKFRERFQEAMAKAELAENVAKVKPVKATPEPEAGVPLYVRCAADIVPVPVSWLWKERLPAGKLVVIAGEPGQGKSRASLSIAAIISRAGFWPACEGRAEQGEVLIANFEDDEADTSVPRLQAERADLSRIRFLEGVPGDKGRRAFDITQDTERLAAHLEHYPRTRLLVVDPISACLGGVDSHKNAEIRGILQPLSDVAKRYGVCVVAITHLNKGDGKALHRVIGSIAFTAAARVVFAIVRDENDPDARRTLFLPIKNNLGNDRTGLSFTTEVTQLPSGIYAPRIEWGDDAITTTADEALSEPDDEEGAGREARDFLRNLLADGPRTSKEAQKEADSAGITQATLRRAREKLRVEIKKDGLGPWTWNLPGRKS